MLQGTSDEGLRVRLKNSFPWLVPIVRTCRNGISGVRDGLDEVVYVASCRRGIQKEIRPGIRFRVHPRVWRKSFLAFAPGGYVADELDAFVALCKPGMQLVDIGAEYGIFGLVAMAWRDSAAVLVDPDPDCVVMMQRMAALNELEEERFRIVHAALGSEAGVVRKNVGWMHRWDPVQSDSTGAAGVSSKGRLPRLRSRMTPLDNLVEGLRFAPTHLKIDVEGHELEVLAGGERVLERFRPTVHLEVHNGYIRDSGAEPESVHAFMTSRGYRLVWFLDELGRDGKPFITRTCWRP